MRVGAGMAKQHKEKDEDFEDMLMLMSHVVNSESSCRGHCVLASPRTPGLPVPPSPDVTCNSCRFWRPSASLK